MSIQLELTDTLLMPDSILRERLGDVSIKGNPPEVFIGEKPRLSTCSDVTWLDEKTLVASNLNGQSLHAFHFNEQQSSLEHKQTIRLNYRAGGIDYFEKERVIAVTNSSKNNNIELFSVDEDGTIQTQSFKQSKPLGTKFVHGVQFSPDGRFLFVAQLGENPSVVILNRESLEVISRIKSHAQRPTHYAKSFCFTQNEKWVFCSWASSAKPKSHTGASSFISIHAYDPASGEFSEARYLTPLSESHFEGITLLGTDTIIAVDQYGSRILQFDFDEQSVSLSSPLEIYKTTNGWSSIHGVEDSPNNKYLAITDHVLDAVHLFKIS
jgi:6-phosphogluconolactonase (cycloisomerase 2 family)